MDRTRFPTLVKQLYGIVDELERMFSGRHFTPDGHMVGSLGEAIAAHYYGLRLLTASTKGKDAEKNGKFVEIKATQRKSVAFRCEPEHLLVLKIHEDGQFTEIYNGFGKRVWDAVKHKPLPSNGQYQLSLARLSKLNVEVSPEERLKRIGPAVGSL